MTDLSGRPDRLLPAADGFGLTPPQLLAAVKLAAAVTLHVQLGLTDFAIERVRAAVARHGWAVDGSCMPVWPETKTAPGGFPAPEEVGVKEKCGHHSTACAAPHLT